MRNVYDIARRGGDQGNGGSARGAAGEDPRDRGERAAAGGRVEGSSARTLSWKKSAPSAAPAVRFGGCPVH